MMLSIDSSAWIEYLRRSAAPVSDAVTRALRDETAATTDIVVLELMSGTADPARLTRWQRLLARGDCLEQRPRADVESAAAPYRSCRRAGEAPRVTSVCLVAPVALRRPVTLVHRDRDFEVLARHTTLLQVTA